MPKGTSWVEVIKSSLLWSYIFGKGISLVVRQSISHFIAISEGIFGWSKSIYCLIIIWENWRWFLVILFSWTCPLLHCYIQCNKYIHWTSNCTGYLLMKLTHYGVATYNTVGEPTLWPSFGPTYRCYIDIYMMLFNRHNYVV